jgi:SAM-dependent methyltransferase
MIATDLPLKSADACPHGAGEASAWVQRWAHLVRGGGSVLDIACGHGRHMKYFAGRGHKVVGVDRSPEAVAAVAPMGEVILADIENGPWPLTQAGQVRTFDGVIVTNYLWRALFPVIAQSVAPGGVLIYETFASGNESVGKPSRADFLLQAGELLRGFADLHVVAYENGFLDNPARFVQRLVAIRAPRVAATDQPARHPL